MSSIEFTYTKLSLNRIGLNEHFQHRNDQFQIIMDRTDLYWKVQNKVQIVLLPNYPTPMSSAH